MTSHQKGFVLIAVLVFINIITVLEMVNLIIIEMQMRMNSNARIFLQTLLVAQAGLKIAYRHLSQENIPCLFAETISSYRLLGKSQAWWHSDVVCHGRFANQNFQYIVEPLSIDECAVLHGNHGVRYYRLTARAETFRNAVEAVVLQSTVVLPFNSSKRCAHEERELFSVWQSFRRL